MPKVNEIRLTWSLTNIWGAGYGSLTRITSPNGRRTADRRDRSAQPSDAIALSATGQLTQTTDALQHTWQYADAAGDLASVTDPLSQVRSQFVDQAGRVITSTDPLGRVTRTGYDTLNRVTAVTDPQGGVTSFTYDANSNLLSLSDALTHTTSNTLRLQRPRGEPDRPAVARGDVQLRSRRPSQPGDRSQGPGHQLQLRCARSPVAGDLRRCLHGDVHLRRRRPRDADRGFGQWNHHAAIRRPRSADRGDDGGRHGDYTYDADGRRASMTVAGQTGREYDYDDAHRLTSITQGSATVVLAYDAADRRTSLTYPNGIVASYTYDAANHLAGISYVLGATTLGDLTYTYDAAGNRVAVGGTWARTNLPPALASATYDAANRIATWCGVSFNYDLNGSLTGDGTTTYTWNARNQLASMSGGVSASFAYDGLRRRRSKTVGGATTGFLFDGWNFVQELTAGGTPTANLVTGLGIDQIFMRADSSGTSSLLVDGLGIRLSSPIHRPRSRRTTHLSRSGQRQCPAPRGPMGKRSRAARTTVQGWTLDRVRNYTPMLQRFLAEDPLEFGGGDVNLGAYVRNDPVSKTDPLGLSVKNCTDQPKKVKPEHSGEPPFILPPMTECPDCHPDGVAPVSPDAPWTKVPSDKRWPADVTIYPPTRVVCSWTSVCRIPGLRPYIPAPGSAVDRDMRNDRDWSRSPVELPPERKKPLGRKDCGQ